LVKDLAVNTGRRVVSIDRANPVRTTETGEMTLQDSLRLFGRLGVNVQTLSQQEFTKAYYELAKRYHPDIGNRSTQQLMANINAARANVLQAYRGI
jgi:hypothetical protein